MDYLFVPGGSSAEVLGKTVLSQRPSTTPITLPPAKNHVAGLVAKLSAGGAITPPIGDILLVAHGNENGEYGLPLSSKLGSPADFEEARAADTADVIRIPAAAVTPSGGGGMNTITIRIRGCNVGKAKPFVEKLQQAMTPTGGSLSMTAPLHFDEFHAIHGGHVEFLAHKFTLYKNDRFVDAKGKDDRPALLAAFDAEAFTYLDGTAIPAAAWDDWVPKKGIHPAAHVRVDMQVDLDPPANSQTAVSMHREYRYESITFKWTWGAPDPGNDHDRIELLRSSLPLGTLGGEHRYDPAYDWPIYERYGFDTLDEYVDNLPWKCKPGGGKLNYRATQHQYTVMLPITDPPGAGVPPPNPVLKLYNFFPSSAASGPAVQNLDETNTDLFLIL